MVALPSVTAFDICSARNLLRATLVFAPSTGIVLSRAFSNIPVKVLLLGGRPVGFPDFPGLNVVSDFATLFRPVKQVYHELFSGSGYLCVARNRHRFVSRIFTV